MSLAEQLSLCSPKLILFFSVQEFDRKCVCEPLKVLYRISYQFKDAVNLFISRGGEVACERTVLLFATHCFECQHLVKQSKVQDILT